jgi:hypothetical protein
MKKTFLLLLILLVLVGCATWKVVDNRIVHNQHSFECDLLSEDWKITSNDAYAAIALQFINKSDNTLFTIFTITPRSKYKELEGMDVLDAHFSDLASHRAISNFKVVSKEETSLNGVRAGLGVAEFETNTIQKKMKACDANFNNLFYEIVLFGDKANFGKHVSEFDNFIKTFKFIRK